MSSAPSTSAPATSDPMASSSSASSDPTAGSSGSAANAQFGPGCAQVPKTGKGSFSGMANDPVATAASNNPLLSTLVSAVTKANLAGTLNSSKDITVFAPANSAFAKIPEGDLQKTLNDNKALTTLLTNHVVKGRLAPDQLAGEHTTLAGDTIKVTGTSPNFDVAGAKVLCGNVQTQNATVYIVDTVLTPQK
ncbi:lipoprotein [Barrientosiimonas endolithica]|uniref:Lipoprotein n=2 Tax=Barrientosiimonas endolithica TaxID=1535208 RepID=A0ABN6YR89_9MICO|nr:lipoprotein [Barrientosiimonas endolithica]